jgi:pyrroline-5-carboxylate reductase
MTCCSLTLIGFGAIGRSLLERTQGHAGLRITHVVVSHDQVAAAQEACRVDVRV